MTELTIKLKDDSKLGLLLSLLRRLASSESVELSVEQNGQEIPLDRAAAEDDSQIEMMLIKLLRTQLRQD